MGSEVSTSKELTQNGNIPEKHENGSANGISANITSNGLEIDVKGETIVQQNGKPLSLSLATESSEPDSVVVKSDCQPVEAQVISEVPEPTIQKEEVKKSKEEKVKLFGKVFKKKAGPPADVKNIKGKENSNENQMDGSPPVIEPQLEEEVVCFGLFKGFAEEKKTTEKLEIFMIEESSSSGEEDTVIVERQEEFKYPHKKAETLTQMDRKTKADISMQTGDDDNTTANSEGPVEETSNQEPSDNQTTGFVTEQMIIMEKNVYGNRKDRGEFSHNFEIIHCNPEEESIRKTEKMVADENKRKGTVRLELSSSLPSVVADCVEAVFAGVSESTDDAAVNTSEPRAGEVITRDNSEGAGDMSADAALIETAEPDSNAVTPEAGEPNGVPSLDAVPVSTVMETISEFVHEKPNPTPANQNIPGGKPPASLETEILVKEGSTHEEITAVGDAAVENVAENRKQEKFSPDDEPSEKCESFPEEEYIIVETPSNELITIEELLKESPDDKVKSRLELQCTPAIVNEGDEVEAAIDLLCQDFEHIPTTLQEPAANNGSLVEEELITAAVFVPLSRKQEASVTVPEKPVESKTVDEKVNEEAIEALLKDLESLPEHIEGDVTEVAISEEPVEKSMQQPKSEMLTAILETTEDEDTEEIIQETDSGEFFTAVEDNTEDSQIASLNKPAAECVETVLKTIAEEITTGEDECNFVTSEKVAETIAKRETKEKAENDSQSADMKALLIRLQSACTSVVEESAYRLDSLEISSRGHSIIIVIHVASKAEQQ